MLEIFSADLPDMDQDGGLLTETSKPELKRPPMYKVILMNDDTLHGVCNYILKLFLNGEKATQIMLKVHTEGSAVVGIYPEISRKLNQSR